MKVVTWNTWWCFGPWRERQPLLQAAVAAQAPDVVLLQETWPAQARAVADAAGLAVVASSFGPFEPAGIDGTEAAGEFGNAVLGRPGETEVMGSIPLSSPGDGAPRNGVAVRWAGDGAGTETLVVATHLNHVAAASEVRSRQLDMLGRWIDTIWPEGPAVVGGDLNLTPYSPEYTRIVTRWADLWPHARPADPGSTMVLDNPRFRDIDWMAERNGPGAPPGVRFDYLLARLDARGGPGLTVQTIDVIGGADHGWPSDHLGLVADIALIG